MMKRLTHRIVKCQRCHKKLRLPIKFGKILRVDCSGCGLTFDVSYKVSDGLFKWLGLSLALLILGLFLALLATNKNHKIPLSPEREAPVIEIL